MNKSKKANRINVEHLVYSVLQTDDDSGVTYGPVKPLAPVMQVQLTPAVANGELFGEGVQSENIAKVTGLAAAIDANKVPIENRAEIQGNTYKDGVLVHCAEDEAPYIAVGYRVPQTNNTAEYVWLLKGRATPMNANPKQSEKNINFSTDSLTINFIPRDKDKQLYYLADSANEDFTKAQADKWFTTGPDVYPQKS